MGRPLFSHPMVFREPPSVPAGVVPGMSGVWNYKAPAGIVDPGARNVALDATPTPTTICISTTDSAGTDQHIILAMTQPGDHLVLQQRTDATKWGRYTVSAAITDHGTWVAIPVSVQAQSTAGPPAANADIVVQFFRGGTAIAALTSIGFPASFSTPILNAWVPIVTTPPMRVYGGWVQVSASIPGVFVLTSNTPEAIYVGFAEDGAMVEWEKYTLNSPGGSAMNFMAPDFTYWVQPPAGVHTFSCMLYQTAASCVFVGEADSEGDFTVLELS